MTRGYHREVPPLSQTRAYGALVAIVALWGSYPATAKLALQDFPPFFLAAVRCSVASFFLAWLLARSPVVLPIPGTSSVAHLEENLRAAEMTIRPEQVAVLDHLA